ncbi:Integrase, catalytic core [Canna indica]|uniref:Integrase, catalytic core n=1 Tax=Canna indica TaxID=4628 RepID=A0AAQ3KFR4_9LILI|nr:Integrase, catalytic core [Canna indica]
MCRGLILNSVTDNLYDLYSTKDSPKEIWNALETKYQIEKKATDKFLTLNYFDYKMTDDKIVMDQVH